jgi:hypothetical protein
MRIMAWRTLIVTDSTGIGDGRVRANPDAFVQTVTEILGELAEDVAIDFRAGLRGIDGQMNVVGRKSGQRKNCDEAENKGFTTHRSTS